MNIVLIMNPAFFQELYLYYPYNTTLIEALFISLYSTDEVTEAVKF